jgi:hypothetical protein
MTWNLQKINMGGNTNAPQAVDDPFVSVYNGQQHVAYRDQGGVIWDVWWDGASWRPQQINLGGQTSGVAATVGPSVGVYNQQQHFCYVASGGYGGSGFPQPGPIIDSFYDGSNWHLQEIDSNAGGPGAAWSPTSFFVPREQQGPTFRPSIWTYVNQQHFTYLTIPGDIYDAFWDGTANRWDLQKLNNGGNTQGPPAVGDPFACVYAPATPPFNVHGQQHVGYRDAAGTIWDPWYDAPSSRWRLQQINVGGNTAGPAAVGGPVVWVWSNTPSDWDQEQHFTYRAADGSIQDAWYDGPSDRWSLQQINVGGNTAGPPAVGNPSACVFVDPDVGFPALDQFVAYRDEFGAIWNAWYSSPTGRWNLEPINLKSRFAQAVTDGPGAAGEPFLWAWSDDFVFQLHVTYRASDGSIWDAFLSVAAPGPGGRG